ncbi:MAG: polyprenyl synthetase family protein [Nanoarchaeota archaeon]|nr:polyprenyl synthetase family protein [Nanoarchaeota archaeon]
MMNQLRQSLREFKSDFDRKIVAYFDAKIGEQANPELKEVFGHLKDYVLAGGKRLRPNILYRINQEFKQLDGIDNVLLAFEFLHNSTLIDDDVIDEHDTRRSRATLPTVYGDRNYRGDFAALLSANLLRNAGIDLIVNSELSRDFQRECGLAYQDIGRSIDLAQILDLEYRGRLNLLEEDYIAQADLVAARFIAYMFQLCTPEKYKEEFYQVGRNLGIAFQLADDLMDIDATKQKGRGLGSDIREGTPTLLSIYASERLEGVDREKFRGLFGKKDLTEDELQWIITQYENSAVIEDSRERVRDYINRANHILSDVGIPQDHWIVAFGEYSLQRSH